MNEAIFLILGICIGAAIAWIYASNKVSEKFRNNINELNEDLQYEKELRIRAVAESEIIKKSEVRMKETFESLAGKVMQSNSDHFLKMANETMTKFTVEAGKDFKYSKEAVGEMLKPLKESLTKHEQLVHDLQDNSNKTFGSLKTYLEALSMSQKSLEKETGALVTALKSPKVRGRWGEIGLKRIVEFSGMSEYCDFEMQVNLNTEEGRLRPDMIVSLPAGRKIAVDSKVPLNSYLEMLETDDENQKKQHHENHAKAVAKHMRDLASKQYWTQFDDSVDFVVLYIEVEPAFGAALSLKKELLSEAISNRIVFATPTTLIALLQTIAFSWKQHGATENAIEIWKSSKDVYERLALFTEYLQKVGGNISTLVKSYNQAVGSWESRVLPGIRKMENLGVSSEKKTIVEPEQIDLIARE